jgi:probable rRNA maturation factor
LPIPRKRLRALLGAALTLERPQPTAPDRHADLEVSLVFCDDDFIQQLNRDFRSKDGPTDVLSFPQDAQSGLLGDIVISVPTADRQARERKQPRAREIEWLFLHGLLHLLGYDHQTEEQGEAMDSRARLALDRAGDDP